MGADTSTNAYRLMLEKLDEIELALSHVEASSIQNLAQDIEKCLEEIKATDRRQRVSLTLENNHLSSSLSTSHASSIKMILEKNTILTERIKGMKALLQNEVRQVKIGRTIAKGYTSYETAKNGSIIDSAN